jgi:hypothetical protein
MGNLVGAALPNGTGVSYVIDGNSQRVGKKVNGALVKGFLYRDPLRIVAELDGAGALVSRFVYAGGSVPAAMIKGASTFRILTDGVGSVRLVVDTSNGTVVQRIDYDSFGNVILVSNRSDLQAACTTRTSDWFDSAIGTTSPPPVGGRQRTRQALREATTICIGMCSMIR